jgi:riboflavin synthase
MFTGIINDTTNMHLTKQSVEGSTLTFEKPTSWNDLKLGESISTNGICLTVAALRENEYDCIAVPETLARTTFGKHLPKVVNLERALKLDGRLDGHFVQGHVDSVGQVSKIEEIDGRRLTVTFDPANRVLAIYKGSITIDGVSLTISEVSADSLQVAVIPYTLEHTTIHTLKVGDQVNLEFDVIGKYVINSLKNTSIASNDKNQP